MHEHLVSDDLRRLSTWAGAIAQYLRPEVPIAHTAEGLRLGRKGSLSITAAEGWFDHEAGKGGHDTLSLIAHLRNCKPAGAVLWARTFLAEHSGDGELNAGDVAEAAAEAGERRKAYARHILEEAGDPLGTPAEAYLRSRGLAAPYPPCVKYLPDARLGESAVVGLLSTAAGEVVGAQLTYICPEGRKSTVAPQRQILFIEKNDQAAFHIPVTKPAEDAVALVIVEGLEDALSISPAGVAHAVIALPGVGRFSKFDLPPGTDVVVFRDGDDPRSPASKQLGEAIDRWVGAGVAVRVTDTPAGEDANSLLVSKGGEEA